MDRKRSRVFFLIITIILVFLDHNSEFWTRISFWCNDSSDWDDRNGPPIRPNFLKSTKCKPSITATGLGTCHVTSFCGSSSRMTLTLKVLSVTRHTRSLKYIMRNILLLNKQHSVRQCVCLYLISAGRKRLRLFRLRSVSFDPVGHRSWSSSWKLQISARRIRSFSLDASASFTHISLTLTLAGREPRCF